MGYCRTYRYRLNPTVKQALGLERLLGVQCELYNAALEERQGAWRWERRSISYVDQCRTLTELREARPEALDCGVTVCRGTLRRLDLAFKAFYRRVKHGETPGFPRYRARARFDSLQWEDITGWKLKTEVRRLRLLGIGEVKIHLHREVKGTPKAITVKREGRRWWVSVRCVDVPADLLLPTGLEVGIDLGVVNVLATSDALVVQGARFERGSQQKLAEAQRALSTKQRGSNHRRRAVEDVARLHRKVRDQRRDFAHKLSRSLVNNYDVIVMEDLKVTSMVRRPRARPGPSGTFERNGARAKGGLNRSIHDAGWGELRQMLAYKAEEAGRELVLVNPKNTSRRCAHCGHTDSRSRPSQAEFECVNCGHRDHADVNAAKNVLWAGRAQRALARAG